MCSFAENNIFFTNSSAQSYNTLPSHFSIFTSLYPSTHRVVLPIIDTLENTYTTLPEVLKRHGYATLYFGPSDSVFLPLDKGLGRGFDFIESTYTYRSIEHWNAGLNMLQENKKRGVPTFLFLHTYYVHEPYVPGNVPLHFTQSRYPNIPLTEEEYFATTPEFVAFVQQQITSGYVTIQPQKNAQKAYASFVAASTPAQKIASYNNLEGYLLGSPRAQYHYLSDTDQKRVAYIKALYDERIYQFDRDLHTFLTALTPLLTSDTILIITADHGEGFMEHNLMNHLSLYSEVLRVPLIMSVPKISPKKITLPVEGIDIYPTIVGMLGITPPANIEGTNVTDAIAGIPFARGKNPIISEYYELDENRTEKTIIDGKWKLYVKNIKNMNDPKNLELYDALSDPLDMHNVASSQPKAVREELRKLNEFIKTHAWNGNRSYRSPEDIGSELEQKRWYFHY